jgi:DNA polymerase III subunit gamma/tau
MNLALKYRPKTFDEVVGQRATSAILKAMIIKGSLQQALLFTGPSGVGKTTMARIVAAELNPDAKEDVHNGTHPTVIEIDGASNGSVEAMRTLKRELNFATAGRRVVIIDEVHAISDEAKAVLLNLLEFPPDNVTFILITTEAHRIPTSVRHRCDHYFFKQASVADLVERLSYVRSEEQLGMRTTLLNLIAQRSEGSFREALMLLEQAAVAGVKTVPEYNTLRGEVDYGPTLIINAMRGPIDALSMLETVLRFSTAEEVADRVIETLKDIMLMKGGINLTYTDKSLDERVQIAKELNTDQVLKAMKIMWDLQTKLKMVDPVRGLELAFSLIGSVLQTTPVVATPSVQPTTMTLNAMRNTRA